MRDRIGRKRTKAAYLRLYDDPTLLDGSYIPNAKQRAAVTLFPNGEPEVWVTTDGGSDGFRVMFSAGPYGLSVTVRRFIGTEPLAVTDNGEGSGEVNVCQYRPDERSQAFKRWYLNEETEDDIALLGEGYRRERE